MTALDHNTPLSAEKFAEIEDRNERALRFAEDPAWPLGRAEFDRAMLCDEVNRLNAEVQRLTETAHNQARMIGELTSACMAAENEAERLRARVGDLTSLLNNPDRLAEHLMDLRAILAEDERDAYIDPLADGGDL